MKIKYLLSIILCWGCFCIVQAQHNLNLYNSLQLPQRNLTNPAFFPLYKTYVGLPVLSSTSFNLSNSGFTLNDVNQRLSDMVDGNFNDTIKYTINNLLPQLEETNHFFTDLKTNIAALGLQFGNNYLHLAVSEHVMGNLQYPKSLGNLISDATYALDDPLTTPARQYNMSNFNYDLMHYRDYNVGYARKIGEHLTLGMRAHVLFGKSLVWSENKDLQFTTAYDSPYISIEGEMDVFTSGTLSFIDDNADFDELDYLFNGKNRGFSIDLGATYRLIKNLEISASVLGLGRIKWEKELYFLKVDNSYISEQVSRLVTNALVTTGSVNGAEIVQNGLRNLDDYVEEDVINSPSSAALSTPVPRHVYLGANYYFLQDRQSVGLLYHSQIIRGKWQNAFSISYNGTLKNWFGYSINYAAYNNSGFNLGTGISMKAGALQFYLLSDNILSVFKPNNSQNVHWQSGLNLVFGRVKTRKDKEDKYWEEHGTEL